MNILTAALMCIATVTGAAPPQGKPDLEAERRIVQYLKEHVKPGEPLIVSELAKVFQAPEEKKVLDRLFNTFFKIPLFVAQYKASTNEIPALADISRQFNLPVDGEAAILLTIIDSDPRVPKFIKRDPGSGEIVSVDVEMVRKDRRFGLALERTLTGWTGRDAPAFSVELFDGKALASADLKGKNYLLYFWFYGCPPCVKTSPHLVRLQEEFGAGDFTVLAVNADRVLELEITDEQRAAYVEKAGYNFPAGHLNAPMLDAFGNVSVYPTLFLVDAKGVIQKHYVNYRPYETLAQDVENMLKETRP